MQAQTKSNSDMTRAARRSGLSPLLDTSRLADIDLFVLFAEVIPRVFHRVEYCVAALWPYPHKSGEFGIGLENHFQVTEGLDARPKERVGDKYTQFERAHMAIARSPPFWAVMRPRQTSHVRMQFPDPLFHYSGFTSQLLHVLSRHAGRMERLEQFFDLVVRNQIKRAVTQTTSP